MDVLLSLTFCCGRRKWVCVGEVKGNNTDVLTGYSDSNKKCVSEEHSWIMLLKLCQPMEDMRLRTHWTHHLTPSWPLSEAQRT